jgi:hypothetical protein
MPYIKPDERKKFQVIEFAVADLITERTPLTAGDLNYLLTRILHAHLYAKGVSYTTMNEILGVLEAAKLEFNRRIVAPYEDEKIKQNGDVD